MNSKRDLAIKFSDREVFGEFCTTLRSDEIPVKLAGFQVVVLSRKHYKNLPSRSRQFVEDHTPIQISTISEKRRVLPAKKGTEALLGRFTKKH